MLKNVNAAKGITTPQTRSAVRRGRRWSVGFAHPAVRFTGKNRLLGRAELKLHTTGSRDGQIFVAGLVREDADCGGTEVRRTVLDDLNRVRPQVVGYRLV